VRVLSLAFDLMFFSSLAVLIVGFDGNEFAFLPITFALGGIIVQAFFLQRFSFSERRPLHIPLIGSIHKATALAKTKICRYCDRAISADAKICRYCLTRVDEYPAPSAQVTSATEIGDLMDDHKP
jgi:hypothetical protein